MLVDTPPDWQLALRHVAAAEFRRALVLGAPDAGKRDLSAHAPNLTA
jgi:hypothetical protein